MSIEKYISVILPEYIDKLNFPDSNQIEITDNSMTLKELSLLIDKIKYLLKYNFPSRCVSFANSKHWVLTLDNEKIALALRVFEETYNKK